MKVKNIAVALIALTAFSFSQPSEQCRAQEKKIGEAKSGETAASTTEIKGSPRQKVLDAHVLALFVLVKELDKGRPLTHKKIEELTHTNLHYVSVDHFSSDENPGCNPLLKNVLATSEGCAQLELKQPSPITLADVESVFGKWKKEEESSSMTVGPSSRGYVYEQSNGWITFECEKDKEHHLSVVVLTDKGHAVK